MLQRVFFVCFNSSDGTVLIPEMVDREAFLSMCRRGEATNVRAALASGGDALLKKDDGDQVSALHIAASAPGMWTRGVEYADPSSGHKDVVSILLEHGEDINSLGCGGCGYGTTTLQVAAFSGHLPVVETVLGVPGINVNAADEAFGFTALHGAAVRGYSRIVSLLSKHPAINLGAITSNHAYLSLNKLTGERLDYPPSATVLHCVSHGWGIDPEVFRSLIKKVDDPNAKDGNGLPPIVGFLQQADYAANWTQKAECLRVLVDDDRVDLDFKEPKQVPRGLEDLAK